MSRDTFGTNAIRALSAEYNYMQPDDSNRFITGIVLQNITKIPFMTIEQLSSLCSVSVSTFHRFCRSMGYKSFTEFKAKITTELQTYSYESPLLGLGSYEEYAKNFCAILHEDIDCAMQSIDLVICERVVDLMYSSDIVYIWNNRYSTQLLPLQSDLAVTKKAFSLAVDLKEQEQTIKQMTQESLLIAIFDNTVRGNRMMELLPHARKSGVKIAVVNQLPFLPDEGLYDEVLWLGESKDSMSVQLCQDLFYQFASQIYKKKYIYGQNLLK